MESLKNQKESYLDIIYQGRNKEFGSYQLRKNYEKNLMNSLVIIILVLLLASFLPRIFGTNRVLVVKDTDIIKITPFVIQDNFKIKEVELIPNVEKTSAKKVNMKKLVVPIVKVDPKKIEKLIDLDEINKAINLGGFSSKGISDELSVKSENVSKDITEIDKENSNPTFVPDEYPEFAGGDEGLRKYLMDNIIYPDMAISFNIQGMVYVQFLIAKDGRVSELKLLHGIGGGCDEEALRIVRAMPKWNPGKQAGKSVPVYVKLPVVFKLKG